MTKQFIYACLALGFALAPALSYGQNNKDKDKDKGKDKKTVLNVNKLEVIYDDEEYSGIQVDHKELKPEDQSVIYEPPFLLAPPSMGDRDNDEPIRYLQVEDDGAVSEDDILQASSVPSDTNRLYTTRMNVATMRDTVIHLVNHRKNQGYSFPTPERAILTSRFGARWRRWHYGIDLAMPTGEPIYATWDGTVRYSSFNNGGYGNLIVITHDNGLETYYAHLSRRNVRAGERVKAGQTIGLCGDTGRSYGSHLHYEIRYKGVAMNPELVLNVATRQMVSEDLALSSRTFAKVGTSSVAYNGGHSTATGKGKTNVNQKKPQAQKASYYKVRQGDTLSKIAARNGTTVKKLCQLNGLKSNSPLKIGRQIRVK